MTHSEAIRILDSIKPSYSFDCQNCEAYFDAGFWSCFKAMYGKCSQASDELKAINDAIYEKDVQKAISAISDTEMRKKLLDHFERCVKSYKAEVSEYWKLKEDIDNIVHSINEYAEALLITKK